jgi:hypothetical protein
MQRRKLLQWGITPTEGRALRSMGVIPCFWGFHLDKTHLGGGWFLCLLLKSGIVHPLLGELHNIPPLFLNHSLEHTAQPQIS